MTLIYNKHKQKEKRKFLRNHSTLKVPLLGAFLLSFRLSSTFPLKILFARLGRAKREFRKAKD